MILVIVWSVWKERNVWFREGKVCSISQLFYQIRTSMFLLRSCRTNKTGLRRQFKQWTPPPQGWLKVNFDGAFDYLSGCGGLGVIIRDAQAVVIGGAYFKVDHSILQI